MGHLKFLMEFIVHIIIFKQHMNYCSLPQQFIINAPKTLPFSMPNAQFPPIGIVMFLGQALRKSINQYESVFRPSQPQVEPQKTQKCLNNKKKPLEKACSGKAQQKPSEYHIQTKKEKYGTQDKKTDNAPISDKKERNLKPLLIISDMEEQKAPSDEKTMLVTEDMKDASPLPIKDAFKTKKALNNGVTLPVVDLIDAAVIPTMGFSEKELRRKRDNLLKRQVVNWEAKDKLRGDKRELRMLNR